MNNQPNSTCRLCRADAVTDVLNLGPQPISNHFLPDPNAHEALFPLALGRCTACGLVQLSQAPPADALVSPYPWITYNEPESHLDEMAQLIARLPGLGADDPIWGLSFKDQSLLGRLERLGFSHTHQLDLADLGIDRPGAGVETIQERLDRPRALQLGRERQRPMVIVARHILEHAQRLDEFVAAVASLLCPNGYVVFETPDCQCALELCDYTTIWEEHASYFTRATFSRVFPQTGLALLGLHVYPYRQETLLVGIGQNGRASAARPRQPDVPAHDAAVEAFAQGLPVQRHRVGGLLADHRRHGPVAVLGAGHLACAFVNFLGLKDQVCFVADDNPHKQGLFMPGSRLPIRSSAALLQDNVSLCLLSVNPEVEEKVVSRNQAFVQRGGTFASIFPASDRSFLK